MRGYVMEDVLGIIVEVVFMLLEVVIEFAIPERRSH